MSDAIEKLGRYNRLVPTKNRESSDDRKVQAVVTRVEPPIEGLKSGQARWSNQLNILIDHR